MRCSKCGKELKEGAKFCNGCGAKAEPAAPKRKPAELKTPDEDQKPKKSKPKKVKPEKVRKTKERPVKKKKKNSVLIGLLITLLVLLLLFFGGVTAYMMGAFDFLLPASPVQAILDGDERSDEEEPTEEEEEEETLVTEEPTELEETSALEIMEATAPTTTGMPTAPETTGAPAYAATTAAGVYATTAAAQIPETAAMPTAPQGRQTQSQKIDYIKAVYERTYQNQGSYQAADGKYYKDGLLVKADVSNGNPTIDAAMASAGYSTYSLQYYYDDLSAADSNPIFIYAVIDGKEFRYYFNNGSFIRRIGSDGSISNNPEMNSFITSLRDEGASYR